MTPPPRAGATGPATPGWAGGPHGAALLWWVVAPALVAAACVAVVFWPGFMSADSVAQLTQAREHRISDWHPPIMSALWGLLDRLWAGPAPMLLLHEVMLFGGLALVAALRCGAGPRAAALILGVGLWPPVFALLGTVWKDVGMAAALAAAAGLLLWADRRGRRAPLLLALPFLFYAGAVRHNGLFALVPLALWAGQVARRLFRPDASRARGWVAGLLLVAGLSGLGQGASRVLAGPRHANVAQAIFVLDLVGVSRATGRLRLPGYVVRDNPDLLAQPGAVPAMTGNPLELAGLARMWRATVLTQTGAYLGYRAEVFTHLLGLGGSVCYPFHPGIDDNALGISLRPNPLRDRVLGALEGGKDGLSFRLWLYVVLALGVLVVAWRRRHAGGGPALAVAASGLGYLAPYTVLGPACDFRYGYWTLVAALLGAILVPGRLPPAEALAPAP